nr:hypothetical protein [uncultured Dyadobacter sp.]
MRYLTLFLLALAVMQAKAQTASDRIFKIDQTTIEVVVDEIGETEIIYFLPKDTAKRTTLRIPRKQVWKIVYESGETEIINTPVATPAPAPAAAQVVVAKPDRLFLTNKTMITGRVIAVTDQKITYRRQDAGPVYELTRKELLRVEYSDGHIENFEPKVAELDGARQVEGEQAVATTKKAKADLLSKISVTAGVEGNYLVGSKIWTDDEKGAGLRTALGGSVRGNYQISRLFGAYLTLGYSKASVLKSYLSGEEVLYKQDLSLSGPSAGLGIKYFLKESVYLHVEGRGNFLKMKISVSEDGEKAEDQLSATCPSFGGGIGVTRKIAKVILEADVHYQMMKSAFKPTSEPIHMVGVRLAVGMGLPSKKSR